MLSINPTYGSLTPSQQAQRMPKSFNAEQFLKIMTAEVVITPKKSSDVILYSIEKKDLDYILKKSPQDYKRIILFLNGCSYVEENLASIINSCNQTKESVSNYFVSADSWFTTISFRENMYLNEYFLPVFTLDIYKYSPEYDYESRCNKLISEYNNSINYTSSNVLNLFFNERDSLYNIYTGIVSIDEIHEIINLNN